MQVSLQNKDRRVLKSGDYVKFAPNARAACVFTLIGDTNIGGAGGRGEVRVYTW